MLSKNLYDQMCLYGFVCVCVCVCVCARAHACVPSTMKYHLSIQQIYELKLNMLSKKLFNQMRLHGFMCMQLYGIHHAKSSKYPTNILVKIKHVKQDIV